MSDTLLPMKVAVLGSYSVELLARRIEASLHAAGAHPTVYVGSYNQYRQELLDPRSDYYRFAPDITLLALDALDLFASFYFDPFSLNKEQKSNQVTENLGNLQQILQRNFLELPQNRLFINQLVFPPETMLGALAWNSEWSVQEYIADFNVKLCGVCREVPNVRILDFPGLALSLGYSRWYDPRLWYLARCRMGNEGMSAAARLFVESGLVFYRGRRKCLVLDLDNTLWGGVVGVESLDELQLGNEGIGLAFQEFQHLLAQLRAQGILLAVNSKNNFEEAVSVIDHHPWMILRRKDFAVLRINWSDKVANLREIAEELGLGMDSLVFFDDDAYQRDLVRNQLPEVLVVDVPSDPATYAAALLGLRCFWSTTLTEEDTSRAELYEKRAERERLKHSVGTLEDFYRSLEMKVMIRWGCEALVPRIGQLLQRTNQFNLTSRRYDQGQIRQLLNDPYARVLAVELEDRLGKEGIIGVAILIRSGEDMVIDTLLLSCRVIGRTVETAVIAHLVEEAKRAGAVRLLGQYVPSKRNACVASLYSSLGFRSTGEGTWAFDLQQSLSVPAWIEVKVEAMPESVGAR